MTFALGFVVMGLTVVGNLLTGAWGTSTLLGMSLPGVYANESILSPKVMVALAMPSFSGEYGSYSRFLSSGFTEYFYEGEPETPVTSSDSSADPVSAYSAEEPEELEEPVQTEPETIWVPHEHTDACYEEHRVLTCCQEEHEHTDDCFDEYGALICGEFEHIHDDNCYTTEYELVCGLDEGTLYREFGVNAEYLIDHAFGREPTTIADIQAYRPQATSTTTGQVLSKGYAYEQAYTVLREMVDNAVLDLIDKHVVCDSISLFVGYASERADIRRLDASGTAQYVDGCGHLRSSTSSIEPTATAGPELAPRAPKPVQRDDERRRLVREAQAIDGIFVGEHGGKPRGGYAALFAHSNASRKLPERTNSFKKIMGYFDELWAQTVDPKRPVKRINLGFGNLMPEEFATIDLFSDIEADERERDLARAVLAVKGKYGKNALVKGLSFTAGATARERNDQVGGHRA